MRILLVEDHPALAQVTSLYLRDALGHEVEVAADGRTALHILEQFVPGIALIDINLPDTTGYDLAVRIRADAKFDETILVALTGWGNLIDQQRATAAGFDAQFRKPMDFDVLPTLKRFAQARVES